MSDEQWKNLLSGTRDWSGSWNGTRAWSADGTHDGFAVMSMAGAWDGLYKNVKLTAGHTYTFSACVKVEPGENHLANIYVSSGKAVNDRYLASSEFDNSYRDFSDVADGEWHIISHTFAVKASKYAWPRVESTGGYKLSVCAYMLVEGTEPAAWAPAEGETLAGGGALMSANLLAGVKPEITQYGSMADGVLASTPLKDAWQDVAIWPIAADTLADNQTMHIGLSAKWHGAAATTGAAWASVKYADAAGNTNAVNVQIGGITTEWKRLSLSPVVPSGMRIVDFRISADHIDAAFDATGLVLSYGSPVCLASSAHTPYATQDHLRSEYATKLDVAYVELGTTASRSYSVGDLVSVDGTLCRITQDVALGAGLVGDTNYAKVTGGVGRYVGTPTYTYATKPTEETVKADHDAPCFVYVVDTASFYYVS